MSAPNSTIASRFVSVFVFALSIIFAATGVAGAVSPNQQVYITPSNPDVLAGDSFVLDVNYNTSDGNNQTSGIWITVLFNSNKITYNGYSDWINIGGIKTAPILGDDSTNLDGDDTTDKKITMQAMTTNFPADWPGVNLPIILAKLNFTAVVGPGDTAINVVRLEGDPGYGFEGQSSIVSITVEPGIISGAVFYAGTASGSDYVGVWDASGEAVDFDNDAPLEIQPTNSYEFSLQPGTYVVAAYRDSDGGGSTAAQDIDDNEPVGFYTTTAGTAGQNGDPTPIVLGSGDTTTADVVMYDYPYITAIDVDREKFPTDGQPSNLPTGEVLFAEVTAGYLPAVDQVIVTVTGTGIDSPTQLLDNGQLPDETPDDGIFTGWVSTGGTVSTDAYTFTATANNLHDTMDKAVQGDGLALPNATAPDPKIDTQTPLFDWDAVDGAAGYYVYIFSSSNPSTAADRVFASSAIDAATTQYQLAAEDVTLAENTPYYWFVQAVSGDNSSASSYETFTIDLTPPQLTNLVLDPVSPVKAGQVDFTLTFGEDMNQGIGPTVTFGAGPAKTVTGSWTNATTWDGSYTIATGYDGNQTISVAGAEDVAGNVMVANTSNTFVVDTTKPQVESIVLAPTSPVKAGETTFTVTFNEAMDDQAPVAVVFGEDDKAVVFDRWQDATTWIGTYTVAGGYDGEQTITVSGGADVAGNTMDADGTHTFVVDTTAPETTPSVAAGTYGTTQNVALGAADANATTIYYEVVNADPGADPAAPTAEYSDAIELAAGGPASVTNYWIVYYAVDAAGNAEDVKVSAYEINTNAPTTNVTFNDPPNTYGGVYYSNNQAGVTVSFASSESVIYYEVSTDGSEPADPTEASANWNATGQLGAYTDEGTYWFKYYAKSTTNNLEEQIKSTKLVLDFTAPAAPVLTAPTTPTNVTPQQIGGTKDADTAIYLAGVVDPVVPIDSSTNWSYTLNLDEGDNPIAAVSRDAAGNTSDPAVSAIVLDTVAPQTTGHDPARNTTNEQPLNKNVIVHITDDATGVDTTSIRLTVNGTEYLHDDAQIDIADDNPNDVIVTFTPPQIYPAETSIPVVVNASDEAGNPLAQDSYTFLTGANVGITVASVGLAENQAYVFEATGGSLPYTWTVTLDGNPADVITPTIDTTATFNAAEDGEYTVTVTDAANDTAQATADVINPVAITNWPEPANLISEGLLPLSASGGKEEGVVSWSVQGNIGTITPAGAYQAPAVTAPTEVTIVAADATYGDITDQKTITVYPPLVVSVDDPDGIVIRGETAQFSVTGGLGTDPLTWSVVGKGNIGEDTGLFTADEALTEFSTPETVTVTATDPNDASITDDLEVKVANKITVAVVDSDSGDPSYSVGGDSTSARVKVKGGDKANYTATVNVLAGSAGTLTGETTDGDYTVWTFSAPADKSSNTVTIADDNAATDPGNFQATTLPINVWPQVTIVSPTADQSGTLPAGSFINLAATGGSQSYAWSYTFNNGEAQDITSEQFKLQTAGTYVFTVTDVLLNSLTDTVEIVVNAPVTITEADGDGDGKYKWITVVGDTGEAGQERLELTATGGATATADADNLVTWSSNAPTVADVETLGQDAGGTAGQTVVRVVPVGPGYAQITATDPSGLKGTFRVKVVPPLQVSPTSADLFVDGTVTLTPTGGAFLLAEHLGWNPPAPQEVPAATVDPVGLTGLVTARTPGTATITVTDSTPGLKHELTATAEINVAKASIAGVVANGGGATVDVDTSASFDAAPATVTAGADGTFKVEGLDDGTYYVRATSGELAGAYSSGVLVAAGEQKTGITITLLEGLQIAVDPPEITAITNEVGLNLFAVGGTPPYTWTSGQGTFTGGNQPNAVFTDGVDAGATVTITVTDSTEVGGPLTKSIELTVLDDIEVATDPAAVSGTVHLKVGDALTLTPTGGTNQFTISSSNQAVVAGSTVDLTAAGTGTATITVADQTHPLFKATVAVEVHPVLDTISLTAGTYTTATDGTPIVAAGGSVTFGVTGGSGDISWSADGGTFNGAQWTAPSDAGIYTITATDDITGATQDFQVAVPVKITPRIYSWIEGGAAKEFTASGLDDYLWTVIAGLGTTADHTLAGTLTNETNATATFTPGDVTQTTPFRLEVNNGAGDLDARLVARTGNLTVINTRTLTGTVYDVFQQPIDGSAVANLVSTLDYLPDGDDDGKPDRGYGAQIQNDGTFEIDVPDVPGVTYSLRVKADGYVPKVVTEAQLGTVVLTSAGGSIKGQVTISGAPADQTGNLPLITAYLTVYDSTVNDWVKRFVNTVDVANDGSYTVWYEDYGQYTIVATKPGHTRAVASANVMPAASDATNIDLDITPKTQLRISTQEVFDSNLNQMVTKIRVSGTPAFGGADTCNLDLTDIDLDGDGLADTTNYGTLTAHGFTAAVAATATTPGVPAHFAYTYTPIVGDDFIGITVQGRPGTATASRVVDYNFIVHPEQQSNTQMGGGTEQVDSGTGGSGQLDGLDTDGDGIPDTLSNIGFSIPSGSLVDPNPDDTSGVPTVLDVFVGAQQAPDETFMSDVVEVTLLDALGRDLRSALGGDVIADTSPVIITINYNPERFDPTNYRILYREKNADGTWGAWQDGTADGTITVISIDPTNHTITFSTTHLSAFGVGAGSSGGGGGGVLGSDLGGGCFIATAAYGSLFEPHVKILRQFRDVYLLPNRIGKAFVATYYKYSPPAADYIAERDTLRSVVRIGLAPLVGISYTMLHTTAAEKSLMLLFFSGLTLAAFGSWRRRRDRKQPLQSER